MTPLGHVTCAITADAYAPDWYPETFRCECGAEGQGEALDNDYVFRLPLGWFVGDTRPPGDLPPEPLCSVACAERFALGRRS